MSTKNNQKNLKNKGKSSQNTEKKSIFSSRVFLFKKRVFFHFYLLLFPLFLLDFPSKSLNYWFLQKNGTQISHFLKTLKTMADKKFVVFLAISKIVILFFYEKILNFARILFSFWKMLDFRIFWVIFLRKIEKTGNWKMLVKDQV